MFVLNFAFFLFWVRNNGFGFGLLKQFGLGAGSGRFGLGLIFIHLFRSKLLAWNQFVQLWSFVFLFCLRVWQNGLGPSWTTLYILCTCLQLFTYYSKITEERMPALDPNKPPSVHFNQASHSSVFVQTCDARTLLGTVTQLFIPASVHFMLFKCTLADLFIVSPHV